MIIAIMKLIQGKELSIIVKANFILPEFAADCKLNIHLLDICKEYPEVVQPCSQVYGFYGNFPNCIWNGGRYINGMPYEKNKIKEIFNLYNDYYGLPLRLTFTNPVIDDEKYCYDTYANIIAECGHNGKNEILVVSPVLEEYLRKNYPNYKYCRSIIATEKIPYNIENYSMSVLPRYWINDWKILNEIPLEDRKKLEVICNDACIDDCPNTYNHYRAIGEANLNKQMTKEAQCIYNLDTSFPMYELSHGKRYVDFQKATHMYLPKGYQYFKLCGRENPAKRRLNWVNYIFKPEYRDDILIQCFKN